MTEEQASHHVEVLQSVFDNGLKKLKSYFYLFRKNHPSHLGCRCEIDETVLI